MISYTTGYNWNKSITKKTFDIFFPVFTFLKYVDYSQK